MINSTLTIDVYIDANGMACPMPLLKAKQALNRMQIGQVLEVLASDSGSWRDFHTFAQLCHHQLLLAEQSAQQFRYWIRKGEKPSTQGCLND